MCWRRNYKKNKSAGKFYQRVRGILQKWEVPKKGKLKIGTAHARINVWSRNLNMDQGRY
jgi:hypothetical protein